MKKIFLILFMLPAFEAFSQSITTDKMLWHAVSTTNASNGTLNAEQTLLVTSPQRIEWQEESGKVRQTFAVDKVISSWKNISSDGTAQFVVHNDQFGAVILIERKAGKLNATIVLGKEDSESYELDLNAVEKI